MNAFATNWVAPQMGSTVRELINALPCLNNLPLYVREAHVREAQAHLENLLRSCGEHAKTNLQLVEGFTSVLEYDCARMSRCHCGTHC